MGNPSRADPPIVKAIGSVVGNRSFKSGETDLSRNAPSADAQSLYDQKKKEKMNRKFASYDKWTI